VAMVAGVVEASLSLWYRSLVLTQRSCAVAQDASEPLVSLTSCLDSVNCRAGTLSELPHPTRYGLASHNNHSQHPHVFLRTSRISGHHTMATMPHACRPFLLCNPAYTMAEETTKRCKGPRMPQGPYVV
jgi:hypothetical protein